MYQVISVITKLKQVMIQCTTKILWEDPVVLYPLSSAAEEREPGHEVAQQSFSSDVTSCLDITIYGLEIKQQLGELLCMV